MQGSHVSAAVLSLLIFICRGSFLCVGTHASENESNLLARDPSMLQRWAQSEILFYGKLKTSNLIHADENGESIHNLVSGYINDFERSNLNLEGFPNGTLEERVSAVISNPVASVFMIRRVVNILSKLKTELREPDPIYDLPLKWPTTEDLKDALLGLLRLCHMYNLDLKKLAAGELQGIQTGARLTSKDMYDIGTFDTRSTEYIATSIELLELAYMRSKIDREIEPSVVKEAFYDRILWHDKKMNNWGMEHFLGYSVIRAMRNWGPFYYFLFKPRNERMIKGILNGESSPGVEFRFQALCRHGSLLSPSKENDLFCWYEHHQNPYFIINPLKAELLLKSPALVQFYNVLGDNKIQRLKGISMPGLKSSGISTNEEPLDTASPRTSVSFSLNMRQHPEVKGLLKTVEIISGLIVRATKKTGVEGLQISAYTFAGFYEPHYDMVESNASGDDPNGSRLATFMYYLEEPKLGGYTVFPKLNVAVRPVKGSAVLWYNMHRNGGKDPDLLHGACPVVLGEKWVGTKWISQYDQFLNRKCTLKRDSGARFQPLPIPADMERAGLLICPEKLGYDRHMGGNPGSWSDGF